MPTIHEVIASFRHHAADIHAPGERDPHEDDIESVEDMEHDTWIAAAEELEKALADLRVEILHVRDPDSACSVSTWVNGELAVTHVYVEDIDPGRGYTRDDWDSNVRSVEESDDYSPDFKAAVLSAMADPPGSEHIG